MERLQLWLSQTIVRWQNLEFFLNQYCEHLSFDLTAPRHRFLSIETRSVYIGNYESGTCILQIILRIHIKIQHGMDIQDERLSPNP